MASNVRLVHQESLAEAIERENSDLATAIMQNKAEASPALNSECVDVLRLTRHEQAAEVAPRKRRMHFPRRSYNSFSKILPSGEKPAKTLRKKKNTSCRGMPFLPKRKE